MIRNLKILQNNVVRPTHCLLTPSVSIRMLFPCLIGYVMTWRTRKAVSLRNPRLVSTLRNLVSMLISSRNRLFLILLSWEKKRKFSLRWQRTEVTNLIWLNSSSRILSLSCNHSLINSGKLLRLLKNRKLNQPMISQISKLTYLLNKNPWNRNMMLRLSSLTPSKTTENSLMISSTRKRRSLKIVWESLPWLKINTTIRKICISLRRLNVTKRTNY